MNSDHPRMLVLRRTAWISTFLVLCIIGFSATIRLSAAGLGCEPWPQCYGQPAATPHAFGTELLRILHRVAAVVLLPLLLMLIMGGFSPRPQRWPQRWTRPVPGSRPLRWAICSAALCCWPCACAWHWWATAHGKQPPPPYA